MAEQMNPESYQLRQVDVRLRLKESDALYSSSPIDSPDAAVRVMAEALKDLDREMVCVVNMDTKNRPINFNVVSIGSLNESIVPIQNVFKSAILSNAASIMLLHTHPSGAVQPSPEDDRVTGRLANACALMGVNLVDHIIIGSVTGDTYSYNTNNPELLKADAAFVISIMAGETHSEYGGMNTMRETSFENFSKQIGDALKKELASRGIEGEIRYEDVKKIGRSYHGMAIVQGESNVSPVFDLDRMYAAHLNGEPFPLDEMAGYVENAIGLNHIKDGLMDYDHVKDSLFIRVSNINANRELLDTVPYTEMEDLMVTYHISIDSPRGEMAAQVTNHMLEDYGITKEQLHQDALESSVRIHPGRFMTMQEATFGQIEREMRAEGVPEAEIGQMRESMGMIPAPPLYVITNTEYVDGAAAMLYPEIMEQAAEKLGDSFFILPSSRHEVILVPPEMGKDYRDLEDMVHQVNESQVAPEDRLSDHVYHFEHGGRGLELAKNFERRQRKMEQTKAHKQTVGMEL